MIKFWVYFHDRVSRISSIIGCRMKERMELQLIPEFVAEATGRMELQLMEMGETPEGSGFGE